MMEISHLPPSKTKPPPPPGCIQAIKRDITTFFNDLPPGIAISPDESDVTLIHSLIIGPLDTPYEGGFFYLILCCPSEYPLRPPKVKLMTTGEGKVQFHPNIDENGEICLDIIGSLMKSTWSPVQSLRTVLLSIQSLMNDEPCLTRSDDANLKYYHRITYETMKVAVCDMMENSTCDSRNMPQPLREFMEASFIKHYDRYIAICEKNQQDPLSSVEDYDEDLDTKIVFNYKSLLERLSIIRGKLTEKNLSSEDSNLSSEDDAI